ncbi:hypothetical protein [Longitalea luteola]|nr:hypothetical protein [Longitalea luteola]
MNVERGTLNLPAGRQALNSEPERKRPYYEHSGNRQLVPGNRQPFFRAGI